MEYYGAQTRGVPSPSLLFRTGMAFIGNLDPHRSNTEHDFILTRRSVLRHCTAVERIELWARGRHHGPRVLTTLLLLWGLGEIFGGGGRGLSAVFTCSLVMVSKNKGTCRKLPGIFISNIKKTFFLDLSIKPAMFW